MKLSRPVLAAATAVALVGGSFTAVNSSPVIAPLVDETNTTVTDNTDDTAAPDARTPGTEAEADADTEADTEANAAGAADAPEGAVADDPSNPATLPGDLDQLIDQPVPEEIAREAEVAPDNAAAAPNPGEMRRLTSAPKMVGSPEKQGWFGQSGVEAWEVFSPSMNRWIPVAIIPATGPDKTTRVANAPTLYMLNGAGGSEQDADWIYRGGADEYFPGQGVNIVVPMEGAFSYYVDWLTDGETLNARSPYFKGAQKWTTFLGRELREPVENYLGADKSKRGVVGMSMSATSSLLLAEHYPGEYQAVGSFSGCAATSTPIPWAFTSLTINRSASSGETITPAHAWGPMGSPYNRYNDALVNAEKLEGSALYISNASGLAAMHDMYGYRVGQRGQSPARAISGSMTTTVEGGVIEAATNACTHDLRAKLNGLNIPAHFEFRNAGTHSWPVWEDDMRRSWETVIGPALLGDKFVAPEEELPEVSSWNADKSSN